MDIDCECQSPASSPCAGSRLPSRNNLEKGSTIQSLPIPAPVKAKVGRIDTRTPLAAYPHLLGHSSSCGANHIHRSSYSSARPTRRRIYHLTIIMERKKWKMLGKVSDIRRTSVSCKSPDEEWQKTTPT